MATQIYRTTIEITVTNEEGKVDISLEDLKDICESCIILDIDEEENGLDDCVVSSADINWEALKNASD